jgi:DNA recombination protein RmuC
MFVPGEAMYSAAMEKDPALFEDAFGQRVLIATPTTLIALVKAIAYGWQQEKLAENAQKVASDARDLYERLSVLGEHMGKLGKTLRQSVENYNRAVGSLEGRVLPAARRFEALGVAPAEASLEAPGQVETEPRALSAAELLAAPEGAAAARGVEDGERDG